MDKIESTDKLDNILNSLIEAHNLLAKTNLPSEVYQPISSIWAKAKLDLFEFRKTITTILTALENIIDTKEAERVEWANLCIRKEKQIEGMRKDMNMAMAREVAMLMAFQSISQNLILGNLSEAKKIADANHEVMPPESIIQWAVNTVLSYEHEVQSSIEAIWKACVKFIQWYNKEKLTVEANVQERVATVDAQRTEP